MLVNMLESVDLWHGTVHLPYLLKAWLTSSQQGYRYQKVACEML